MASDAEVATALKTADDRYNSEWKRVQGLAGRRVDGLKGHSCSPFGTRSAREPRRYLLFQASDYAATVVALKAASSSSVVRISCANVGASMFNAACIASGKRAAVASRIKVTW
jgi:hypothetical protein